MPALPAYAASTWTHTRYLFATCPSSSKGSTAAEEVVPTVAHKKKGVSQAATSATSAVSKAPGERAKSEAAEVRSTRRFSGEMPGCLLEDISFLKTMHPNFSLYIFPISLPSFSPPTLSYHCLLPLCLSHFQRE
ncbi:hypothetical protein AMTRI_Chr04g243890 [Amborella trichopoda]